MNRNLKLVINNPYNQIIEKQFFEKNELKVILDLYAKMVSEGTWKDYGLNISSRRRHTRFLRDWSSDVCSSDLISIIGVLIFVGLTAYDTQKIKNMYLVSDSGEMMGKKAVMGALTLYLDFINLFIMLLRLFGQRR